MSTLSDGLEARDKATPGPWYLDMRGACLAIYPESKMNDIQSCRPDDERNIHFSGKDAQYLYPQWSMSKQAQIDATVMVAAPDALDWIARVLPWLKTKAFDLQDDIDFMEKVWRDEPDSSEWLCAQEWRKELEPITALIAQAEGMAKDGAAWIR